MTSDELLELVALGATDAVRAALAEGADPNLQSSDGSLALDAAVGGEHFEIARLLLEAGANPNLNADLAPLYLAREPAMIALLLDHGADPDWCSARGETALTFAAHDGSLAAVELLVAGGANLDLPLSDWPPTFYAAMQGHLDVLTALADGGAELCRVHEGRSALTIAVDHKKWEIARFLVDRAAAVAGLGDVDPAGVAREKGQRALAEQIAAHRFSPVDEGLRGRLLASRQAEGEAPIRVVFELENVGDSPRFVPEEDPLAFSWEVTCDDVVVQARRGRAEVLSRVGWKTLVPGERWAVEVSLNSGEPGAAELDLVTQIWAKLPEGRLHLSGTYRVDPKRAAEPPKGARAFVLALPSCFLPSKTRNEAP